MLRYLRTEPYYRGDSAHEIFIDDFLWRFGAELHRFNNPGGVPYSAIYRYGEEEMSCERGREEQMFKDFRQRVYSEVTGGRRNRPVSYTHLDVYKRQGSDSAYIRTLRLRQEPQSERLRRG